MCNTAHRKKKVIGNRNNLSCLKFLHFLSWNFINLYIKSDKVFYLASIYKNVKMDEIRRFPFYWFLKPKPVANQWLYDFQSISVSDLLFSRQAMLWFKKILASSYFSHSSHNKDGLIFALVDSSRITLQCYTVLVNLHSYALLTSKY